MFISLRLGLGLGFLFGCLLELFRFWGSGMGEAFGAFSLFLLGEDRKQCVLYKGKENRFIF